MKGFTALGDAGHDMARERYAVLIAHRERVMARFAELHAALNALDARTAICQEALAARGSHR